MIVPCAGLKAAPVHKAQAKTTLISARRRLRYLFAISAVSAAVMLAFPQVMEAQFVDSGTWLSNSVTGKLPS